MLLGKYLNKYYIKYWYLFLLGVLALIAVDYVCLYEPLFLGQIVDHLSEAGTSLDIDFIGRICLNLLGIAVVMFFGRMLWRYTLFNASQRIEAGMRREMFQKAERLSQNYYHSTKIGSIMSWFTTDLETIEEYTGFGTVQIVDSAFLGVLVIVKMLRFDWVMTLLVLIPMSLIILWGALVEKYMAERWQDRQDKYDKLYDFAQENFSGISVIKAFVKETSELHAFAKVARKNQEANINFVKVAVIFDTLIEIIIGAILALILGFGSWFTWAAISGDPVSIFGHVIELTPGGLITFIGYFDMLIWPMIALGSLVSMHGRARASLNRVNDFLDAPEDVKNPEDPVIPEKIKGSIEFKGLSFSYPSAEKNMILEDVSFKIEPGELIGIVGRVGSGKTTLMTLLLRLYNVKPGTVFVDGIDIMDMDVETLRENIAFVPQDNFLFSDTVRRNISLPRPDADMDTVVDAARFAEVKGDIEGFSEGFDTVTGERGVTLSGGQKQRISVARAYLKNAPIMVLDDSVSAVDVDTEERLLENIKRDRAGLTTIIIASRVSSVSRADRILVLKEGRLEAFDTPERLMDISPTYAKMVYLQELENEVKGGKS